MGRRTLKQRRGPAARGGVVAALIYTRVSSEDQRREGLSLAAQIATCRQYVARHEGWVIEREYQDVLSGTNDARPAYQQLLADARQFSSERRSLAVVVARLDRFGRRVLERVRCREEFKHLGIPTHSVAEGGEVSDLVANILASTAEEEVRRLAERISEVRSHIVRTGWAYPARTAFGYRLRDATPVERAQGAPKRVLEPDPLALGTVQEAFAQVAAGRSVRAVGLWLASLPAASRGSRSWCFASARSLLSSPTYIARPAEGVADVLARPVGHWPAIVQDATWAAVQVRIANHARMPRSASGRYLLTGLIRCHDCGSRMTGRRLSKPSQARYRCIGWLAGANHVKPGCSREVALRVVDTAVLGQVGEMLDALSEPGLRPALERAWRVLSEPSVPDQAHRISQLEKQAETARGRLADGAALLVDGTLDRQGYEALRDRERTTLEAVEAELVRVQSIRTAGPQLPPLRTVLALADGWRGALLGADVPAQRDVLGLLVDHVTPNRVGRGKYEVSIVWTALGEAIQMQVRAAA